MNTHTDSGQNRTGSGKRKRVLVLGATGSIGTSTLDCIRNYPERFTLAGFSAYGNGTLFDRLRAEFPQAAAVLVSRDGTDALDAMITETPADVAVNGIAGSAGLFPSKAVLEAGVDLALANKETAIMAGNLIFPLAEKHGCKILPVDSEHSAVFHLIEAFGRDVLDEIILTASGGPFRTWPAEKIACARPEDALRHPTWSMGAKITVDSASLANKGMEVLEACALFGISPEKIRVAVHPQSLVHSLIRTADGDLYAQISPPDMRRPILSALCWPEKQENRLEKLSFRIPCEMTFEPPRLDAFPLLPMAFRAAAMQGSYPIAFNAANEEAVRVFLEGRIPFSALAEITAAVLEEDWSRLPESFAEVSGQDRLARAAAGRQIERICGRK